jgi:hypothetical protein
LKLRRAPEPQNELKARATRRLSLLDSYAILDWADQAGSGVARALSDYRREGVGYSLEEAKMGLEGLLAGVEILLSRHQPSELERLDEEEQVQQA